MSDYELRFKAIEARLAALESGGGKSSGSAKGGKIADDKVFHGQYGNPDITIDPKAWDGPSMKGQRFSDAPIEWLELAATMYDAFGERADKEGKTDKNGKQVAWRDYQKAALCRRWSQEKRAEDKIETRSTKFDNDPPSDPDELPF